MTEALSETTYAFYPVFRASEDARGMSPAQVDDAAQEVENLLKEFLERGLSLRGAYSTAGFRADADLMLWLIGPEPEILQDVLVAFRRTAIGRATELAHSFMGVVKPAEFTADHAPAFVKGEPPGRFLCVYPFVRTAEWYLLATKERAAMLLEHGEVGREFPDVLANTTSAFGIGDWEWILAFEAERLDRLVDCIRRLRDARARLYTKVEVPFVTGVRKELRAVIADLA